MKHPIFHLILFCLILPGFVIAQQRTPLISGTVTDVQTKEPLGGIEMRLETSFGFSQTVMTNAIGQYTFKVDAERFRQFEYRITADGIPKPATNGHRYLAGKATGNPHHALLTSRWIADFELQCADCGEIDMPQIHYELCKWELRVDGYVDALDSLRFLYQVLMDNPTIVVELQAHTDTRGNNRSNEILSQKRAEACVNRLIEWGVPPERMVPVGYGESRPRVADGQIAALHSAEEREVAHSRNRRTVFVVLATDYVPLRDANALIYKCEGTITDVETKEPLGNMLVTIEGTDGYVQHRISDPSGHYEFETDFNGERCIRPNTSYTVTVGNDMAKASNGHRYLSARGQETTVGITESTAFVKDFYLQCMTACSSGPAMPAAFFPGESVALQNAEGNMQDSLDYLVQVLEENPTIVIELAGHAHLKRGSDRKEMRLSQQRADECSRYLISQGIESNRLIPVGYGDTRLMISEEEIAELPREDVDQAYVRNNRVVFAVISFDYVPSEPDAKEWAEWNVEINKQEEAGSAQEQQAVSNTWHVYPNPTKDAVLLRSDGLISEWQLLDMEGRLLHQQRAGYQQQRIDLKKYPAGTYFIRWDEGGVTNTAKVVKQ